MLLFNVALELRNGLLATVWDSPLGMIRRRSQFNKTDSNVDEEYKLPEPIPKEKEIADTLDSKMGIIDEVIKLPESIPKGTEITDQMDKKTDNKTASNADEKYKLPEPIPKEKEIADKMRIADQLKKYLKPKRTETKDQMDKKTDKKTDSNADEKYKLPEPIPKGTEIADQLEMKTWIIGEVINSGGFGTLYCAADKESPYNFKYAVKIEYMRHDGPFSEIKCYRRIGDPEDMLEWTMSKQLRPLPSRDYRVSDRMANRKHYLGLSPFCGAGCLTYNGSVYRFLVIKRFGKDLQTLLEENNGTFPLKTVCLIGLSVIDALEYVHTCGYVHNDIKASNLLLGHKKKIENQVYLVDFSLACKYIYNSGGHVYGIFGAHGTGTPIFMSRDAHVAGFVPKGDLEVLAYNLIYWLTGHLLWQDFYEINLLLELHKEKWMEDIDNFLRIQFQGENVPNEISTLLHYIKDVNYEEKPDYDFCRKQLKELLKSAGYSDTDYTLEFKETGKLKKDYLQGVGNTLDLVVIGGYFRRRKRTGNYCGFLLACYDSDNQKYQSICELVTGFKDDDLEAHTKFLKQHVTEEPKKYYSCDTIVAEWFEPVQVWEITCADLYLSPLHTAAKGIVDPKKGISLRYPRFVKIREDKSIEDVTSSSQIADMYRNQQQIQNT